MYELTPPTFPPAFHDQFEYFLGVNLMISYFHFDAGNHNKYSEDELLDCVMDKWEENNNNNKCISSLLETKV